MPVELLWSTGGTGNRAASISFVTPSPVPAPGYICFAIESGDDPFVVTNASSLLPYRVLGSPYGGSSYAATVIWKVQSGSFSGGLTVDLSETLNDYAFTAWAVTGATLVYYSNSLPKRCVSAGGNLFLSWLGYTDAPGQLICQDLTLVREDTDGSYGAQSYLFALTSDHYSTYSDYDWVSRYSSYSCWGVGYDRYDYWFIAPNVYAPDPLVPSPYPDIVNATLVIAPINHDSLYDITNVTFSPLRPKELVDRDAALPHDMAYAVYARGASLRPNNRPARDQKNPLLLGDTWPALSIAPGVAQVLTLDDAALLLEAGLGSVATSPTVAFVPGAPSVALADPTTTYTPDPVALSMLPQFGYQVPGALVVTANAFGLRSTGVGVNLDSPMAALAPVDVPKLAIEFGAFAVVPALGFRSGRPSFIPSSKGELELMGGFASVQVSTPSMRYSLSIGRASVFLASSGGGTPPRPVAPCLIRLARGSTIACFKDYKVFEVQEDESGRTIRIGLALTSKEDRVAYQFLLGLTPGQLVQLDTIIAGGFRGWYRLRDISSVALPHGATFDILLKEEEHHG